MEYVAWTALMAPRGTPSDVIAKINADVRAAIADPTVKGRIQQPGNQVAVSSPEELAEIIRTLSISNGKLVQDIGLTPQ